MAGGYVPAMLTAVGCSYVCKATYVAVIWADEEEAVLIVTNSEQHNYRRKNCLASLNQVRVIKAPPQSRLQTKINCVL